MRYGRLLAISQSQQRDASGVIAWLCKCDCGNEKIICGSNLTSGKTKSCGCLRKELSSIRAKKNFTKEKIKCSVNGCESDTSHGSHGMCGKHAQRFRRYGDVNYVTPEDVRRERSRAAQLKNVTQVKSTTYRKNMGKHEHRAIAESQICRKLLSTEHVHHKDGNKHNNSPDNLVVMSRSDHFKLHAKQRKQRKLDATS